MRKTSSVALASTEKSSSRARVSAPWALMERVNRKAASPKKAAAPTTRTTRNSTTVEVPMMALPCSMMTSSGITDTMDHPSVFPIGTKAITQSRSSRRTRTTPEREAARLSVRAETPEKTASTAASRASSRAAGHHRPLAATMRPAPTSSP